MKKEISPTFSVEEVETGRRVLLVTDPNEQDEEHQVLCSIDLEGRTLEEITQLIYVGLTRFTRQELAQSLAQLIATQLPSDSTSRSTPASKPEPLPGY